MDYRRKEHYRLTQHTGVLFVLIALIVALVGLGCLGEEFVVEDLQLISWESLLNGNSLWTAPIEAATILAWFAEHGYPQFMPDFNNDGVVDEEDTIKMADTLGSGIMETAELPGTTDAALVWGLANVILELAPNTLDMRIYDTGFPSEWETDSPGWVALDQLPGIEIKLLDDARYSNYRAELLSGAMIILGLEGIDEGLNYYLAGRSFHDAQAEGEFHRVDLAWAEDDPFIPGSQGQILLSQTGKTDEKWYVEYIGGWAVVEFMLALSPIGSVVAPGPSVPGPQPGPQPVPSDEACCPDLIVSVEATCDCRDLSRGASRAVTVTNLNPECPVNTPFNVLDTLEYGIDPDTGKPIITDTSIIVEGEDLAELNRNGSVSFWYITTGMLLKPLPCPSAVKLTLTVDSDNVIDECFGGRDVAENNNTWTGEIPCAAPSDEACCPDLIVSVEATCTCKEADPGAMHPGLWFDLAQTITVTNLNPECPINMPFLVRDMVEYGIDPDTGAPIIDDVLIIVEGADLAELNSNGSVSLLYYDMREVGEGFDLRSCPSALKITVTVDNGYVIDECFGGRDVAENNNTWTGEIACPAPKVASLPDLVVSAKADCSCSLSEDKNPYCKVTVDVYIGNLNPTVPVPGPFAVRMDASPWSGMQEMTVDGQALQTLNDTGNTTIQFSFSPGGRNLANPCGDIWVTADIDLDIDETDETNNITIVTGCCDFLPELVLGSSANCSCALTYDNERYCVVKVDVWVENQSPQWPILSDFDVTMDPSPWHSKQTYTITGGDLSELNRAGAVLITFQFSMGTRSRPAPKGCLTIQLEVDPNDRVRERTDGVDPNSNIWTRDVCCVPDLVFSGSASCDCTIGSSGFLECEITVDGTISNLNPGNAVEDVFYVAVDYTDIRSDQPPALGRTFFSFSDLAALNRDGQVNVSYKPSFDWFGDQPPCGDVIVWVDWDKDVAESNEANNQIGISLCCTGGAPVSPPEGPCPDLVVHIDRSSCTCDPYGGATEAQSEVLVKVTVENIGTANASSFRIKLTGDSGSKERIIPGLAAGAKRTISLGYTFMTPFCGHTENIEVTVDNRERVEECDETNNSESRNLDCY